MGWTVWDQFAFNSGGERLCGAVLPLQVTVSGDVVQCSTHQHNHRDSYSRPIMSERRNTLVCCFDPSSPHISAFDIHELIHSQLQVAEHSVLMTQIGGLCRQVFIKFTDQSYVHDILHVTNGTTVYKHTSGEISTVQLEIAGLGTRHIQLTSLPPELPSTAISTALAPYREIQSIHNETWSKHYCYVVPNGVWIVTMTLTKHIPSHVTIARYRAITSYEGQPQTYFGCGNADFMHHVCPKRRGAKTSTATPTGSIWAHIAATNPPSSGTCGTLDNYAMDTDIGHQPPQQIPSAPTSIWPEEHKSAPLPDTVEVCNMLPREKHGTPVTARHTTTPLIWADDTPDDEQTERPKGHLSSHGQKQWRLMRSGPHSHNQILLSMTLRTR